MEYFYASLEKDGRKTRGGGCLSLASSTPPDDACWCPLHYRYNTLGSEVREKQNVSAIEDDIIRTVKERKEEKGNKDHEEGEETHSSTSNSGGGWSQRCSLLSIAASPFSQGGPWRPPTGSVSLGESYCMC